MSLEIDFKDLSDENIQFLHDSWRIHKKFRWKNFETFGHSHKFFITMKDREKMLDMLFKKIGV